MRFYTGIAILSLTLGFTACSHQDSDDAARHAGRAAYEFSQKTKEAAKTADEELRKAGKAAQQGWSEAKREDEAKRKK